MNNFISLCEGHKKPSNETVNHSRPVVAFGNGNYGLVLVQAPLQRGSSLCTAAKKVYGCVLVATAKQHQILELRLGANSRVWSEKSTS